MHMVCCYREGVVWRKPARLSWINPLIGQLIFVHHAHLTDSRKKISFGLLDDVLTV